MTDDWSDNPRFRDFAQRVRAELLPKLRRSYAVVSIFGSEPDVKLAVELGLAVLLDKPILVVVVPGTAVPGKVVRVADVIVEADMSTPAGRARVTSAIEELIGR